MVYIPPPFISGNLMSEENADWISLTYRNEREYCSAEQKNLPECQHITCETSTMKQLHGNECDRDEDGAHKI
jgi:hypothetical protein